MIPTGNGGLLAISSDSVASVLMADRRFVLVSGLPASGKSTLARTVAPLLGLQMIDKDDILDRLFEAKGIGDSAWRQQLSRESAILDTTRRVDEVRLTFEALASRGAGSGSEQHGD